jgi:hypothetical protein
VGEIVTVLKAVPTKLRKLRPRTDGFDFAVYHTDDHNTNYTHVTNVDDCVVSLFLMLL